MTNDLLGSLFELQDSRVDRLGNPLVELDEMIDWDGFRKILNPAPLKLNRARPSAAQLL